MPGISLLGDSRNAARNRPTSLPADSRSLSRFLRLLGSPEVASQALLQSLAAGIVSSKKWPASKAVCLPAALTRAKDEVQRFVDEMTEEGWETMADRYAEYCLALAVELVLQDAASFAPPAAATRTERQQGQATAQKSQANTQRGSPSSPSTASASAMSTASSLPVQPQQQHCSNSLGKNQTPSGVVTDLQRQFRSTTKTTAVVSDASSIEAETAADSEVDSILRTPTTASTGTQQTDTAHDKEELELSRTMAVKQIWARLIESIHLQVASRTTRVWGRKKIYEVYQFARPVLTSCVPRTVTAAIQLQQRLESECQSVLTKFCDASEDQCRVYTTVQQQDTQQQQTVLYVQISLGRILDLQDERNRSVSGEKKKKAGTEFVAVLVPGSTLWTLTASRAPSRARYTPHILTVLENVLTETTHVVVERAAKKGRAVKDKKAGDGAELGVRRFGDLSGTEPMELLRAARSVDTGEAVGRFAHMAAADRSNPVEDLHQAATDNLLRPKNINGDDAETARLAVGSSHPGNDAVAAVAAQVVSQSHGMAAVVAATKSGANVLVDHSVQQNNSRKRTRVEGLGQEHDCPHLQRVCWKWAGETTAAAACWLEDGKTDGKSSQDPKDLPTTEFKCSVVMRGENVYQGLQALIDAGIAQAPLPDFLLDAPSMGGTIRVAHGTFASTDAAFESV